MAVESKSGTKWCYFGNWQAHGIMIKHNIKKATTEDDRNQWGYELPPNKNESNQMKMYAPGTHMALSLTVYTQRLQSAERVIAGKLLSILPTTHTSYPD